MKRKSENTIKFALLAIILLPVLVFAGSEPTKSPFPDTKKGINILPIEKINMPMKMQTIQSLKSFAKEGYVNTAETDQSVNALFDTAQTADKERTQYDKNTDPLDTHLKSDISQIQIGFKFSGIPSVVKKNVLGFAAAGGYTKNQGWDGVGEFVRIPNLGICSFVTMKIERVILFKETLGHEINKKASDKDIAGNWNTGFLYSVNWYTDNRMYTFQCANRNLNRNYLKEMVSIAKQIDSGMS